MAFWNLLVDLGINSIQSPVFLQIGAGLFSRIRGDIFSGLWDLGYILCIGICTTFIKQLGGCWENGLVGFMYRDTPELALISAECTPRY